MHFYSNVPANYGSPLSPADTLDAFLAALAKHYDGNPNVEFIDVGPYGLWGEGHTFMSSKQDGVEIQKLHIDLHLKHFKKTQLCLSDDYACGGDRWTARRRCIPERRSNRRRPHPRRHRPRCCC